MGIQHSGGNGARVSVSSKAEADDLAPLGRPNLHGRVIFQAAVEERALRMHAWQEGALLVDNS
jgi:hypothetical protein